MFLPFRGHGYLIVIFYVGALVLTQLSADFFYGTDFYKSYQWPKYLAIGIGALLSWIVGRWLNSGKLSRRLLDIDTGEEMTIPPQYQEFFYIRMEYWGLIGAAACFVITVLSELNVVRF